jgi:hypothetical protein
MTAIVFGSLQEETELPQDRRLAVLRETSPASLVWVGEDLDVFPKSVRQGMMPVAAPSGCDCNLAQEAPDAYADAEVGGCGT